MTVNIRDIELLIKATDWSSKTGQCIIGKKALDCRDPFLADMCLERLNPDSALGQEVRIRIATNEDNVAWLRKSAIRGLNTEEDDIAERLGDIVIESPFSDISETAKDVLDGRKLKCNFINKAIPLEQLLINI